MCLCSRMKDGQFRAMSSRRETWRLARNVLLRRDIAGNNGASSRFRAMSSRRETWRLARNVLLRRDVAGNNATSSCGETLLGIKSHRNIRWPVYVFVLKNERWSISSHVFPEGDLAISTQRPPAERR